jgi:hypothetical protein
LALKNKNNPLLTAGKKFRDIKRKSLQANNFLMQEYAKEHP